MSDTNDSLMHDMYFAQIRLTKTLLTTVTYLTVELGNAHDTIQSLMANAGRNECTGKETSISGLSDAQEAPRQVRRRRRRTASSKPSEQAGSPTTSSVKGSAQPPLEGSGNSKQRVIRYKRNASGKLMKVEDRTLPTLTDTEHDCT